jgi:hypothetical protein
MCAYLLSLGPSCLLLLLYGLSVCVYRLLSLLVARAIYQCWYVSSYFIGMRKHLALLTDVVSGFKSFSETPCLVWKCGTNMSDSHARAL